MESITTFPELRGELAAQAGRQRDLVRSSGLRGDAAAGEKHEREAAKLDGQAEAVDEAIQPLREQAERRGASVLPPSMKRMEVRSHA